MYTIIIGGIIVRIIKPEGTNMMGKILKFNPAQVLSIGFLILIFVGALLLMLPISTNDGHELSFIDAIFEATSAVCVTGLVVVDTGTTFTVFGQCVLLFLIQTGGLGFMTIGVIIAIFLGKNIGLKGRLMIQESLNQLSLEGMVRLVKFIIFFTFLFEAIGALFLAIRWTTDFGFPTSIYYGIFHSISAFNNAGFDIMGDYRSITGYAGDFTVVFILTSLLLIGGLGYEDAPLHALRGAHRAVQGGLDDGGEDRLGQVVLEHVRMRTVHEAAAQGQEGPAGELAHAARAGARDGLDRRQRSGAGCVMRAGPVRVGPVVLEGPGVVAQRDGHDLGPDPGHGAEQRTLRHLLGQGEGVRHGTDLRVAEGVGDGRVPAVVSDVCVQVGAGGSGGRRGRASPPGSARGVRGTTARGRTPPDGGGAP